MSRIRAAALSDIGRVRRKNEDRALREAPLRVFGVADGVGGLPGGGEAAQAAHDSVLEAFRKLPPGREPDLTAIVSEADRAVAEVGRKINPAFGIASTLTCGHIHGSSIRIAHLGDSRCYVWRHGRFSQVTQDHNVENEARRQRALGEIMPYLPAERHSITRCLGVPSPTPAEFGVLALQAGDRYFFCTDGITGLVADREIAAIVGQAKEPEVIVREIVELALDRGGDDNATGVLVIVDEL